jgi:hypothetical protein
MSNRKYKRADSLKRKIGESDASDVGRRKKIPRTSNSEYDANSMDIDRNENAGSFRPRFGGGIGRMGRIISFDFPREEDEEGEMDQASEDSDVSFATNSRSSSKKSRGPGRPKGTMRYGGKGSNDDGWRGMMLPEDVYMHMALKSDDSKKQCQRGRPRERRPSLSLEREEDNEDDEDESRNDQDEYSKKKRSRSTSPPPVLLSDDSEGMNESLPPFISNHIANQKHCFACSHVGENFPGIKGTKIQSLMTTLGTGLRTTNMAQHCFNVSDQYNKTIKNKVKARPERGEKDLPEWTPDMVREHLEFHHNDPELTVEIYMKKIKHIIAFVYDNCLCQRKTGGDGDGSTSQENVRVDPQQFKIFKDLMDMWIKLARSSPEKMTPFYNKNRYHVSEELPHPFFDLKTKNIKYSSNMGDKIYPASNSTASGIKKSSSSQQSLDKSQSHTDSHQNSRVFNNGSEENADYPY